MSNQTDRRIFFRQALIASAGAGGARASPLGWCMSAGKPVFHVFVVACLGIMAFGEMCEVCAVRLADTRCLGGVDPAVIGWGVSLVTAILPAALLTIVYCSLARRLNVGKGWMLASCGALAVVAMLPFQSVLFSDMPGKSLLTIGLGFPPGLSQGVQSLVPLAIGLWLAHRPNRRVPEEGRLRMAA